MGKSGPGELEILRRIRGLAAASSSQVRLGIGDDCAVLRPVPGTEVVVTTDLSLEGRHFKREWHSGGSAGHRCLARGLSDLAAMGAKPMAAFLSLALPQGLLATKADRRWVDAFFTGLLALAAHYGVPLAGGDLATAPGAEILADIVLTGTVPRGKALLRCGASVGDGIYVTGSLGGSAAELARLASHPKRFSRAVFTPTEGETHPHLFPDPRIAVGQALLRRRLATAAIDISDGLSTDLTHLCEESRVGAVIEEAALPLAGTLEEALHGGEDYELLFTSSGRVPRTIAGVPVCRIGTVKKRGGLQLKQADGKLTPLTPHGWEHRF